MNLKEFFIENWVQLLTIILVIVSWRVVPYYTEKRREASEVGLSQYQRMDEVHTKTAEIFYKYGQELDHLMEKYDLKASQANELYSKMSPAEKEETNKIIDEINLLLAKMFIVMPDDKYKVIHETIKTESIKLRDFRENLIVAMRLIQFPDTKFNKREDIRLIYKK